MGISTTVLPDNSIYIDSSLALAIELCPDQLAIASALIYDTAVYNLAGHLLIESAQDQPNQTFFVDLRKTWQLNTFVPGVVSATGDEGTNASYTVPQFMSGLMMSDLDYIKTPYGRNYMSYAQRIGVVWGIS